MGETEYLLITIVFNLFFLLFMVAIFLYMWQYRRKKKENILLLQHEKELHQKELFATQLEMQQKTMQEIGREIHDNVGQKLTLASLYFQQLIFENKLNKEDENVTTINSIINESLTDLRQLSKSLSDDSIEKHTLPELLKIEAKKINKLLKCKLDIDDENNYQSLNYQEKSVLIRISQEFTQNSIKHAECSFIKIHLLSEENSILLSLSDNGKGFDEKNIKSTGIGLQNMKKRTKIIGGKFSISSNSSGTSISIKLPKS